LSDIDNEIRELDLARIAASMPLLLPELAVAMGWAAAVNLEESGHRPGILLEVDGSVRRAFTLAWPVLRPDAFRSWADPDESTEHGACAIAALLVEALTDLTMIERARKGTGFDYWLGRRDDAAPLFQNKTRLEVSGIRQGDAAEVRRRERQKLAQVARLETEHTGRLPVIVVVVEFGTPRSRFTRE
jgi:hypothetical protein